MPRQSNRPRFRTHVRKGRNGQVWVSYFYDMRPAGKQDNGKNLPDIPLGKNLDEAVKKWDELHNRKPRIAGTILEAMEAWEKDDEEGLPAYQNKGTRKNYTQHLATIKPVFGPATWESIQLHHLVAYLKKRTAKTQGNRELAVLSIVWNYARKHGLTQQPFPAAGMERSKWKNKEKARQFRPTSEVFDAIYAEAEPMLKDCMDLSTATGMRLTDCRTVAMPLGDILSLRANKTGKDADFDISLSQVLPDLLARRRRLSKALHTMLLSMPNGRPVTVDMLRGAYDRAREAAAIKADPELADQIRKMYLRDCRKLAANLAVSDDAATELLQHSSKALTKAHYRSTPTKLKPVR